MASNPQEAVHFKSFLQQGYLALLDFVSHQQVANFWEVVDIQLIR